MTHQPPCLGYVGFFETPNARGPCVYPTLAEELAQTANVGLITAVARMPSRHGAAEQLCLNADLLSPLFTRSLVPRTRLELSTRTVRTSRPRWRSPRPRSRQPTRRPRAMVSLAIFSVVCGVVPRCRCRSTPLGALAHRTQRRTVVGGVSDLTMRLRRTPRPAFLLQYRRHDWVSSETRFACSPKHTECPPHL